MDENDLCIGCYRTSKEIRDWLLMEDDERLDVIAKAAERASEKNPFVWAYRPDLEKMGC